MAERVDLTKGYDIDVLKRLPEGLALRHRVVAFAVEDGVLFVALSDAENVDALDDIRLATGLPVKAFEADPAEIDGILAQHFGGRQAAEQAIEELEGGIEDYRAEEEEVDASSAAAVKFVFNMISQAMRDRASDIHIEPTSETEFRVRFRIDSLLREVNTYPRKGFASIVSHIKVRAGLDIAERRRPQDGSFRISVEGKPVDVRVSTLNSTFGEKVVMRLLDSKNLISLDQLGLAPEDKQRLLSVLEKPYGMIAVVGPTGSGKTTTLYACLKHINDIKKNIVTLEDPVEYSLGGLVQTPVNPRAGVTFADGLRAILRQDPDVIMVGETRDNETAKIAVQASLTGHLVLTTLHTNDAVGLIPRLSYMEVEPFLTASALTAVLAQRLVRKVCPKCAKEYEADEKTRLRFGLPEGTMIKRGTGCQLCQNSGYFGRVGVFELLVVDEKIKNMIATEATEQEIRDYAKSIGLVPLAESISRHVQSGTTTPEEAYRAVSS